MTKIHFMTTILAALFAAAGCASSSAPARATKATTEAAADPVAAQIAAGAELYGAECAHCHGDGGEGTSKGPKVVGPGALPLDPTEGSKRDVQFRTALDVFQWASKTMPGDDAGSLSTDEMLKIFAFDLSANGVKLERPLDGALAAKIVLHPETE